jgi:hypothetical protein
MSGRKKIKRLESGLIRAANHKIVFDHGDYLETQDTDGKLKRYTRAEVEILEIPYAYGLLVAHRDIQDYGEHPFLFEFEKLMSLLTDFVKTSNESYKHLTKKDKEEIKKGNPQITYEIFERLAETPAAQRDREKNAALYKSLKTGDEANRIRKIMPHLESALKTFNKFTHPKPVRKRKSSKEDEFWDAMQKHNIDRNKSISEIIQSLNPKGYNFKKTAVSKYLKKIVRVNR